ncbi:hypothetical protein ACEPPN_000362 [Leptodophora sp. 'Broadleaf-Isolate-01']
MPIYFSVQKADLTPSQSRHLIDLTNLRPDELKSHKLVGLRDAARRLFRIFHPYKESDDWKKSWREGKHFLDCLDQVHVGGRPRTKEKEFYDLLKLYEAQETSVGQFLASLSPPILLDVICNNNGSELEELGKDLEQYGKECEAVKNPRCNRLRKARDQSSEFNRAWDAFEAQAAKTNPSATSPAPPPMPKILCGNCQQQIDSAHTAIDQSTSQLLPECARSSEACQDIPLTLLQSQQSGLDYAHTSSLRKRRRAEEASDLQDGLAQSPQLSSDQPSGCGGQPARRKTEERVVPKSSSESRKSFMFLKLILTIGCASPSSSASTPQPVSSSSTTAAAESVDPIIQERTLFISKIIENPMNEKPPLDLYNEQLLPLRLSCGQYYENPDGKDSAINN